MFKSGWSKVLGGFLLGAVGLPLLKTKTAKKVYTYVTAGGYIVKDKVLAEAERIQSGAVDISDDAKIIVENYYQGLEQNQEEQETEETAD